MESSIISPVAPQEPLLTASARAWPPRLWTKRSGLVIVALFIAVQVASLIVVIVGLIIAAGGPLAILESGTDGLEIPPWTTIASLVGSIIAHAGSVLLVGVLIKRHTWQRLGFRPIQRRWLGIVVGLTLGLALIRLAMAGLISWAWPALANFGLESLEQTLILRDGAGYTLMILLLSAVIVPVAEELFFRGFLYNLLRNRWGALASAAVSALIFGAFHFVPLQAILAAVLGFCLALLYERSESLWPPILVHALNNLVFVGIAYLAS